MLDGLQVNVCWENAFGADQSADLKGEGIESRKVNQTQSAEEYPTRKQAVGGTILRIENPANPGHSSTSRSDNLHFSPWKSTGCI